MSDVIVWTKPACVQCRMVKFRLEAAGVPFTEQDLTAPSAAKDLEHFRGLGYTSAPITEYGGIAVPGFMPTEIDRVIAAWREDHPEKVRDNA
jgi:glutaredoxin-like protein NrdH